MKTLFLGAEERLIDECKKGNIKHQELLYKHFYAYAMSICLSYSGAREIAEEILNDSFLKVFNNIKNYKHEVPFKHWLRRIVVNTSIDYYRANSKHNLLVDISEIEHSDFNQEILENLSVEDIMMLIRELPDQYRMVFNLYEIEGYKHNEIAEMMKITEATSRSYLKRAKEKLRQLYNEHIEQKVFKKEHAVV
ncbi:MAG: RNA polymerase subunit sigma-70 [Bacteroidetes bacterium GWF2_33_38]|nr:MAG: RNA polymerase subunit sigma-70 [Bacteroidetes bacterium GWF2_33_38]OFY76664.1 MAG: RNA polymerase subunit sigma-70 [Bacteroidetes bacterium RIFOXYA12_FULL_33_9]OFY86774.1 MAG: RNA polymerase subunit sigma-70 [Bacteroidetes bacterium RIFOXYA2_FULL_33_7]